MAAGSWSRELMCSLHAGIDQAAAGTHVGFRDGRPIEAPTVFVNASRCGRLVATTHDPFDGESRQGGAGVSPRHASYRDEVTRR